MDNNENDLVRSIGYEVAELGKNASELARQITPYIVKQIQLEQTCLSQEKRLQILEAHMEKHCNIVDRGENSLVNRQARTDDILEKREKTLDKLQWLAITCIIGMVAFFLREAWNYYHK